MMSAHALSDLEGRVAAGAPATREDVERLFDCPDLVSVGVVGELASRRRTGTAVTFCRVFETADGLVPANVEAGEIRLTARPANVDEAVALVRAAATSAGTTPVTGFSLVWLAGVCGSDAERLTMAARTLADTGLAAIAETPIDQAPDAATLAAWIDAVRRGGLAVHRLTVAEAAEGRARLALVELAQSVAAVVGEIKAFAPLPRHDSIDTPSTGYDDVKLVAAARVRCAAIERIQIDWRLYGPKLAQVALTFGASDLDNVAAVDDPELGPRRTAVADISRQIRAAGGDPVERDGHYRPRG